MNTLYYRSIKGTSNAYTGLLAALSVIVAIALFAVYQMEHEGHYITGMSNQIVWGLPHVFAIFLIVAASGALNIASIASVFGKKEYKPLSRFSAMVSIAMLAGGLMILVLDLGRPDRLIVAMTYFNIKSIFTWNILLYNGFFVITGIYLWLMMERRMQKYSGYAGLVAFVWRLILTTGTGSIFGFLVARQSYDAALMGPMFVIMSFAFGLALFILLLLVFFSISERQLGSQMLYRLKQLLGIFVAANFYFTVVFHLTNLYATQHHSFEQFILLNGGIYTFLFWVGHIGIGVIAPMLLIYLQQFAGSVKAIIGASVLVITGAFAQLYVIIIGGQAYPLELFPGQQISSSFYDGVISSYNPSGWELALGLGGFAVALLIIALAVKILPLLPVSLADDPRTDA